MLSEKVNALMVEWIRLYLYHKENFQKRNEIEQQLKDLGIDYIGMMYMSGDYLTIEFVKDHFKKIKQYRKDEI